LDVQKQRIKDHLDLHDKMGKADSFGQ